MQPQLLAYMGDVRMLAAGVLERLTPPQQSELFLWYPGNSDC